MPVLFLTGSLFDSCVCALCYNTQAPWGPWRITVCLLDPPLFLPSSTKSHFPFSFTVFQMVSLCTKVKETGLERMFGPLTASGEIIWKFFGMSWLINCLCLSEPCQIVCASHVIYDEDLGSRVTIYRCWEKQATVCTTALGERSWKSCKASLLDLSYALFLLLRLICILETGGNVGNAQPLKECRPSGHDINSLEPNGPKMVDESTPTTRAPCNTSSC